MYATSTIPTKHKSLSAGIDDFGPYGTIFAAEDDHQVPKPDQSTPAITNPLEGTSDKY